MYVIYFTTLIHKQFCVYSVLQKGLFAAPSHISYSRAGSDH